MRKKEILVVVDMQPKFGTSQEPATIRACGRQIKSAIRNEWPIIFLEYSGYGQTDGRLLELVKDYDDCEVVQKIADCGSEEVRITCNIRHWPTDLFRVCGVNTGACVKQTAIGLAHRHPYSKVKVYRPGCNCSLSWLKYKWQDFNVGEGRVRLANIVYLPKLKVA